MDRPPKRWIDPPKKVKRLGERGSGEKREKVGEVGVSAPSSPSYKRLKRGGQDLGLIG